MGINSCEIFDDAPIVGIHPAIDVPLNQLSVPCRVAPHELTLLADGSTHTALIVDHLRFVEALVNNTDESYASHVVEDRYFPAKEFKLIDGVRALFEEENAGGAGAQFSEYLSGVLYHGFGARDFIEEMAVPYWWNWKKVDYLCTMYGRRIGVSVKRAVNTEIMLQLKRPDVPDTRNITDVTFTKESAIKFLDSAIRGLVVARRCVFEDHDFTKSILHVWCPTVRVSKLIREAFEDLDVEDMDLEVKGYLILHLTLCQDKNVYLGR